MRLPEEMLYQILRDLQLDYSDSSDEAILLYKNLLDIIEILQSTPAILAHNRNVSAQFIASLERQPLLKPYHEYNRVDLLFQQVHNRIIEKFKGFRHAFRRFDKNFDGSLVFREFVTGMNEMGINLTLPDFKLLFNEIDFDCQGEIDYFKFCLLDFDKLEVREKLNAKCSGF